jgi:Meckel syndrome type 1 protein
MQAADLLAIIVPGTPGQAAAPGLANGVGKAGEGKAGEGLFGDPSAVEGQGADEVNAFAQALAALMAAPGQAGPQVPATPPTPDAEATADVAADAPNKGLLTAQAATAKAGAPAHGLVKLLAEAGAPATPSTEDLAGAIATDQDAPSDQETAPTTPTAAKTLPETAKADEALARRLDNPPPRSDRAEEVAKGPHLPPWAAAPTATPPLAAAADTPPAPPGVEPEITAVAAVDPSADAETTGQQSPTTLALAASETAPQTSSRPAAPPRAEGRALGKVADKDAPADETAPEHRAQGVGKGLATAPGQLKKTESETVETDAPPAEVQLAQADAADAPASGASQGLIETTHAAASTPAHGDAGRLAPHTVAHLAEQIVDKSQGKATRFDVQLDPAGLGKVDVKIEIGRDGQMTAAMTFDNPVAAAEMRTRAGELRSALEQAGFDLGKTGLSFDFNGQNGGRNLWEQQAEPPRPNWARGAFTDLADLADIPSAARWRQIDADGVDVTV